MGRWPDRRHLGGRPIPAVGATRATGFGGGRFGTFAPRHGGAGPVDLCVFHRQRHRGHDVPDRPHAGRRDRPTTRSAARRPRLPVPDGRRNADHSHQGGPPVARTDDNQVSPRDGTGHRDQDRPSPRSAWLPPAGCSPSAATTSAPAPPKPETPCPGGPGTARRSLQRPAQRRHRPRPSRQMQQFVERLQQARLLVDGRAVTTTDGTQPRRRLDPSTDLGHRLHHRVAAHPRSLRHRRLANPAQRLGHRPGHHPALNLVQMRHHRREELAKLPGTRLHPLNAAQRDLTCGGTLSLFRILLDTHRRQDVLKPVPDVGSGQDHLRSSIARSAGDNQDGEPDLECAWPYTPYGRESAIGQRQKSAPVEVDARAGAKPLKRTPNEGATTVHFPRHREASSSMGVGYLPRSVQNARSSALDRQ